ncbi:MAG: PAS domain S-box protein [Thermodesulfobacteriota bacterium]|nr:PAS domain S-box protein [Thermodesulfobacteriota bacterium]
MTETDLSGLRRLYDKHRQGAWVRSGAGLIMWLLGLIPYLSGLINSVQFIGISASVVFLVLMNPPLLWILSRSGSLRRYEYFSILSNGLEIMAYTVIIHFAGGIEAAFLTPIYSVLIVYTGMVAPRRFPFIIAGVCAIALILLVFFEHFGLLATYPFMREAIPGSPIQWGGQLVVLSIVVTLLFFAAYISAGTSGMLKSRATKLRRTNEALNREIEERRRAEDALRESEERYRGVFENTGTAMVILEDDMTISTANAEFEKLSGYLKEEIEDRIKWPKFIVKKDLERMEKYHFLRRQEDPGIPAEYEFQLIDRQGSVKDIFIKTGMIPGTKKNVASLLDITERKRAEEALRESEEKYRLLVETANDAIFIAQDEMIKFPNPKVLEMVGYTEEELAGILFVNLIHPEDRGMVLKRHKARLMGKEFPPTYDFRIRSKSGEESWGQLSTALTTWEGRPATINFLRDITNQKRLEAQLQQAQKMEAVGTLAGGIAHDFNNLLQAIQGYAQVILLETQKGTHTYAYLKNIESATIKAGELTHNLLTFSRKVESKVSPLNINDEVKQIKTLLRRTIPRMIEIEFHLADDLWTVNADSAQLEQILLNLSVNAMDAMPDGGRLVIETENLTLDQEFCQTHLGAKTGDFALLTVSDTGHGMDKETVEHIFEPFYTTKGIGRGTGLGLAMVYGTIKSHQGYITCYSEVGQGTTFKIYLPAIDQEPKEFQAEKTKVIQGGHETILVVDDEKWVREVAVEILEQYGYQVESAPDGERALEIYSERKDKIDLVLLDLGMPGMGGKKCLEKLVKFDPGVKVVIASGYSADGQIKETHKLGAMGFVGKPYRLEDMLKKVREVLDSEP